MAEPLPAVPTGTPADPLTGRKLVESWDVNTPDLLEAHAQVAQGAVRTRFPPEPNGYLHFGHAKSMYMNFHESFAKIAAARGVPLETLRRDVTFRYDDTNPEKENHEFITSQARSVNWMGWTPTRVTFTSDYFDQLHAFALRLIDEGKAYVCHQTGEEIERSRTVAKDFFAGKDIGDLVPESPYRNTKPEVNRKKFEDMRRGVYAEGEASLRLKMDTRNMNPNLWDPVAYRIMYHAHPRTGDTWCIYPTYDFSHCVVDSLEHIDYSICTLEFETRRESYYWLLDALKLYRPKVYEFARLDVDRTVMSKRKLKSLVDTKAVRGWDDPRMPTLVGMRRRGYSPTMINAFMKEIGVTRAQSKIDPLRFTTVVTHHLDEECPRGFGVLDPVELVLTNVPEDFGCVFSAPVFPSKPENPERRSVEFSRVVYVDRDRVKVSDETTPKDFFGLVPFRTVRLRYGPVVQCTRVEVDAEGKITRVEGKVLLTANDEPSLIKAVEADQPQGAPAKTKGVIHWVSALPGQQPNRAEIRLYDYLMTADEREVSPTSEIIVANAMVERFVAETLFERAKLAKKTCEEAVEKLDRDGSSVSAVAPDAVVRFQLERVGYFCFDIVDSFNPQQGLVLNRIVPLTVGWVEADAPAAAGKKNSEETAAAAAAAPEKSRKEIQAEQTRAKLERLKYSPQELFKRPGEVEKWSAWDADGIPTAAAGSAEPLSKSMLKKLKKEWEQHKDDLEKAAKRGGGSNAA